MKPTGCDHLVQVVREGQSGSFCKACGVKVFDIDPRECGDCRHYQPDSERIGFCRTYSMLVTKDMHVTFKVEKGTCWQQKASGR